MLEIKKSWYVVYTKPRCEKKVYSRMVEKGMEAYCPLARSKKKWSDRIKWVDEPLFKSYVFVRLPEDGQVSVRMVNGVVNFVYWLGKPARVKDKEIEVIRKFLDEFDEVWAEPAGLAENATITIRKGAFMNRQGRVIDVINNKVRVLIESIGYSLVAVVERSNIAVAGK